MRYAALILIGLWAPVHVLAQDADPLFALRSPAFVDPSCTGMVPGVDAVLLSRTQWTQVPDPFRTMGMVAGFGTDPGKRSGHWGFGARVLSDRSGDPAMHTFLGALQAAYHLRISEGSSIALGAGAGYEQRSAGLAEGRWASQYDGMAYDPAAPSGEVFGMEPTSSLTIDAGLSYVLHAATRSRGSSVPRLVVGAALARAAVQRLSGPEHPSLLGARRATFHAQLAVPVRSGLFSHVFIETAAQRMEPHWTARLQVCVGSVPAAAQRLSDQGRAIGFRIGACYRYGDALMAVGALEWRMVAVGIGWPRDRAAYLRDLPGPALGARSLTGRRRSERRWDRRSIRSQRP